MGRGGGSEIWLTGVIPKKFIIICCGILGEYLARGGVRYGQLRWFCNAFVPFVVTGVYEYILLDRRIAGDRLADEGSVAGCAAESNAVKDGRAGAGEDALFCGCWCVGGVGVGGGRGRCMNVSHSQNGGGGKKRKRKKKAGERSLVMSTDNFRGTWFLYDHDSDGGQPHSTAFPDMIETGVFKGVATISLAGFAFEGGGIDNLVLR